MDSIDLQSLARSGGSESLSGLIIATSSFSFSASASKSSVSTSISLGESTSSVNCSWEGRPYMSALDLYRLGESGGDGDDDGDSSS